MLCLRKTFLARDVDAVRAREQRPCYTDDQDESCLSEVGDKAKGDNGDAKGDDVRAQVVGRVNGVVVGCRGQDLSNSSPARQRTSTGSTIQPSDFAITVGRNFE